MALCTWQRSHNIFIWRSTKFWYTQIKGTFGNSWGLTINNKLMLKDAPVGPNIPAQDIERAKKFYGEVLGLPAVPMEMKGGALFDCGKGTRLFIYERQGAVPEHTLATFLVANLETEMEDLKSRGVKFENFDVPGARTTDSVGTSAISKSAWFKDTEGNWLSILQML